jgi:hypothetical protein
MTASDSRRITEGTEMGWLLRMFQEKGYSFVTSRPYQGRRLHARRCQRIRLLCYQEAPRRSLVQ